MNQYNEKNVLAHWSVIELIACSCSNALEEVYMNGFLCVWFVVLNKYISILSTNPTKPKTASVSILTVVTDPSPQRRACLWARPRRTRRLSSPMTARRRSRAGRRVSGRRRSRPAGCPRSGRGWPSSSSATSTCSTTWTGSPWQVQHATANQSSPPNIKDLDSRHTVSIIWFRCFGKTGSILIRGFKMKRKEGKHLTTKLHCYFQETWILLLFIIIILQTNTEQ